MIERALEISKRLQSIRSEIDEAQLIAVTKYSPIEDVYFAYEANQLDFGENRVNDLAEKAAYFQLKNLNDVRWHFIGHLQSNKVKELLRIPHLYAIHSIDSIKILEEIMKRLNEFSGDELQIMLQVNTSHEAEKSGMETIHEVYEAIELMLHGPSKLKFMGLMTLGTIRTDNVEAEAHRCFKELYEMKKTIAEKYSLDNLKLSMGMSGDYKIALKYHSDYIRVGSSIFK